MYNMIHHNLFILYNRNRKVKSLSPDYHKTKAKSKTPQINDQNQRQLKQHFDSTLKHYYEGHQINFQKQDISQLSQKDSIQAHVPLNSVMNSVTVQDESVDEVNLKLIGDLIQSMSSLKAEDHYFISEKPTVIINALYPSNIN